MYIFSLKPKYTYILIDIYNLSATQNTLLFSKANVSFGGTSNFHLCV